MVTFIDAEQGTEIKPIVIDQVTEPKLVLPDQSKVMNDLNIKALNLSAFYWPDVK